MAGFSGRRALAAAMVALGGCAAALAGPVPPAYLAPEWRVLEIDGAAFRPLATVVFAADGTVSGRAPCNTWSSRLAADLPDMALAPIRATRMACDALADEQRFLDALAAMTRAEVQGMRMTMTGPDGRAMLFARPAN
jgi:heat shock protein HslJ